jgi:hypothetical protein
MNIATKAPDLDLSSSFRIPDRQDVIKGELAQNGDWIVANISTGCWLGSAQKVRWRGVDIWIMPLMKAITRPWRSWCRRQVAASNVK